MKFKTGSVGSRHTPMVRKHSARGEMLGSARGWKKIHIKENPPYFFSIWIGNARECFLTLPIQVMDLERIGGGVFLYTYLTKMK